jgi:hypothetical protein
MSLQKVAAFAALSLRGTKSRSNLKDHGGEATYADFVYFLQGHHLRHVPDFHGIGRQ